MRTGLNKLSSEQGEKGAAYAGKTASILEGQVVLFDAVTELIEEEP